MVIPNFVTFTGIDRKTDFDGMIALSSRYPIEWGILIGNGEGNRYPDRHTIQLCLSECNWITPLKFSWHLCGKYVNWALSPLTAEMIHTLVDDVECFAKRIQLNAAEYDLSAVVCCQRSLDIPVVIQVRGDEFPTQIDGITYLHDKSGGRGLVPASRPKQKHDDLVGYAGGIGPDNVTDVLSEINATNFYIDMENKIRTDDWLDLGKCESVCQQIWGT